ncbi:hypothetical protein ACTJKN_25770 [Pedobacter sp. 22163]|uniref:hypothetical protein n=1 Tax=Pedobacter sp. 22163 TaxID=3453883 RepID=UPI003F854529
MQDSTLLHRQVHPNFIQDNKISSQVFEKDVQPIEAITSLVFSPTDKDENKLSVYNGDKYSAQESHTHFTTSFKSAGVVSVNIDECKSIALSAVEDNNPFNGHSVIDFEELDRKAVKNKAKLLKSFAMKRDWTFKK